MGKRVCLAGPGPRDDKQRPITTVLHSVTLFGVQRSKIRFGHRCAKSFVFFFARINNSIEMQEFVRQPPLSVSFHHCQIFI
jgi:hypothetical protein